MDEAEEVQVSTIWLTTELKWRRLTGDGKYPTFQIWKHENASLYIETG